MTQKLVIIAMMIFIAGTGCKNRNSSTSDASGTYSETPAASDDHPLAEIRDSGTTVPAMTPSDTMMANADAHMAASAGKAKPNPAKKGMKGKVTITPAPASTAKMEKDNSGIYANVEVIPSFPNGYSGLQNFFDHNLNYPSDASDEGVEGTVNVVFNVDENGKLTDAHTVGDKLGYGLEEEALRVVNKMPAWTPGKLKGQNVKTKYTLPVHFQLY